ncbi:monocarboxylate transporter 1-like isoform X2 [Maniola jurtina]|uniref:monocarboxylate transporter 1-like isoform X2 n=1 Tax=Maniola jurtina TaxID=191418 RepID=UPI001E686DCB|nr:monocarboxylate transporter 1-like isoform X2 [Maniola jurtina]
MTLVDPWRAALTEHKTVKMNTENSKEGPKDTVPDKWGYVVCFGIIIIFIAGIGHVNSFGLIYKDFIADTHSSAKSLTTAHGVFSIMLAIGGLTLNVIAKRCSLRLGGFIGALIMSAGSFVTVFISSTDQLPFTFGVLQGVGFGMIVPVCYSTFNHYFVRKRTQVMSFIKATQGVILIFYPQLLKVLLSCYGFRSTLLLISGISLHTFPGMAAMKTYTKTIKNRTAKNSANHHENLDLLNEHKNSKESKIDVITTNRNMSLTLFGHDLLQMLNVQILKDPVFCNICIGQSFVNFSDVIFFVLQPMLFYQYGLNTNQVAACISISAGADVAGRFGLAFISSIVSINTRYIFYVATMFTLAARIVILQVRQFIWLAVVTSLLGVLRAWLHIASPLVISHHVTQDDFTGAYALFMLSTGLVNVIFSPIIGLIKDVYQDYVPAFYALTACCLPCLLLWPAEYYIKTNLKQ